MGLLAVATFAVAGAVLALAGVVGFVGVSFLQVLGLEWHWIWENR